MASSAEPDEPPSGGASSSDQPSVADLITPGPSARFDPDELAAPDGPEPVRIAIEGIDVFGAPIVPVGVEPNGEMEIPGATEVGWYQFGPEPGAEGSAVLAAHIAFNGDDGVFRHLADVEVGAVVAVELEDGTIEAFTVVEVSQYDKDELPNDRIFTRDGEPGLALITCGGSFNPELRSYADNVVAYAVPVDDA